MKVVALFLTAVVTALALSCDTQQPVAPNPGLSLQKSAPPATDNSCRDVARDRDKGNKDAPVVLLCAIQAPGPSVLASGTKGWVDTKTERYYLTDVSNAGVDIFDADRLAYVGRVGGFVGAGANAANSGPNSITFPGDGKAWVSDGISAVRVVDLSSMSIIKTISTAIPACDNGTVHNCQRTNEITYDPEHRIVFVENPSPLSVSTGLPIDTYGTFISAVPPYTVLGTISFPDRQGQEAPLWDKQTHRIVTAVSGRQVVTAGVVTAVFNQYVAVINPAVRPFTVEKHYDIDCTALGITVAVSAANPTGRTFGINDPSLGPDQHMVIPACGRPFIMNASTGAFINTGITQVGGGNETWYNAGDGNFYVVAAPPAGGQALLGVIDARSAQLLQTVSDTGGANPAAWAEKNRIFTIVQAPALATTRTACTPFGYQATGCVTVFGHTGKADKDDQGDKDAADDD